jgi:hypothetical protein
MNLIVERRWLGDKETIGKLFINGVFFCYTLEDAIRENKIPGETAIPYGTYPVILSYSPKFKRIMPEILNVPNFTGIRIHSGITPEDTAGCLLVGMERTETGLKGGTSRIAYDALFLMMAAAIEKGEIITINFVSWEKKKLIEFTLILFAFLIAYVVANLIYQLKNKQT